MTDLIKATPEPDILRRDIYDRPPIFSWTRGRVGLLGDSAHAMQPNLGQGGCMAIEDAFQLGQDVADKLEQVRSVCGWVAGWLGGWVGGVPDGAAPAVCSSLVHACSSSMGMPRTCACGRTAPTPMLRCCFIHRTAHPAWAGWRRPGCV